MAKTLTKPRIDELREAGSQLTKETIDRLERAEAKAASSIQFVTIHFSNAFDEGQLRFLRSADRSHHADWRRYNISVSHSDQVQEPVRNFLWNSPEAHACFASSPFFCYEPDRHLALLPLTNTLITPATSALVKRLAKLSHVLAVDAGFNVEEVPDEEIRSVQEIEAQGGVTLISGAGTSFPAFTWGWDRLGVKALHDTGIRGTRIGVGIANSGVCANHRDVKFRVRAFARVTPSGDLHEGISNDDNGHGTHLAGSIAGANGSGTWLGGAPDVDLKVAAVLGADGSGTNRAVLRGIEWLGSPEHPAKVINLSLAAKGGAITSAMELIYTAAIQNLRENHNIITVAAVGNHAGRTGFPASIPSVVSCGAIDRVGSVWSNSGNDPDFVLPGVDIFSCVPFGLARYAGLTYSFMTGTSMAAAHFSSLLALAMQAAPTRNAQEILDAFFDTASNKVAAGVRDGWGEPNIVAVLQRLGGL